MSESDRGRLRVTGYTGLVVGSENPDRVLRTKVIDPVQSDNTLITRVHALIRAHSASFQPGQIAAAD